MASASLAALLDLLGRRWALRLLWELREPAPTFRVLQERCGSVSSSVLAARIAELRRVGVVDDGPGYALTPQGHRLADALLPMRDWATRWGRRLR